MKTTFIYAHLEPDSDEIRYIGRSDDPEKRLTRHLRDAGKARFWQANWLTALIARGLRPRLEIIAEVPIAEWEFWETHYIKYFRDSGFRLTNGTPGGEGGATNTGRRWTPEQRAAVSARQTGRKFTLEHRNALAAAFTGEKNHQFGKTGDKAPWYGRKHSPETLEKMRAAQSGEGNAMFGSTQSPEARLKMSLARSGKNHWAFGRKLSLEHRAKISAAKKRAVG